MKKQNRKWSVLGRRGLASLLVAVMVMGFIMPVYATGDVTEPTEPVVTETTAPTVPETTAATVGDDAPGVPENTESSEPASSETTEPATSETTEPASSETSEPASSESSDPSVGDDAPGTPDRETVPDATVPQQTPPAGDQIVTSPAPDFTAYDRYRIDLAALEEEAKTLEATEEVLDEFYDRLFAVINAAQDEWDKDTITAEEMKALNDTGYTIMLYLKDTYGYENGEIQQLDETKAYSNKVVSTATRAESGITFELYNYNKYINFKSESISDSNVRNHTAHFAFTSADGSAVDNESGVNRSSDETPQLGSDHLKYKMNLSATGYPVIGTCSDGHDVNTSIGYLFGEKVNGSFDHAVTPYQTIINTPLTYDVKTGYYEYSSATNAADLSSKDANGNYVIRVREYAERGTSSASANANYAAGDKIADFFPFNSLVGKDTVNDGTTNITTYYDTDGKVDYQYKAGITPIDYWFGARMHATFYTPRDSVVNGQPMKYEFSGDDDVMVYIDGVFVMDLGGAHARASGNIDFYTGLVETWYDAGVNQDHKELAEAGKTADKYYAETIYDRYRKAYKEENNNLTDAQLDDMLAEVFVPVMKSDGTQEVVKDAKGRSHNVYRFKDYTNHTFDWFYMERYCGQANFNTKFNLPTLPANSLTVAKDVKNDPKDTEFQFQVDLKDSEGKALSEVEYSINGVKQQDKMQLNNGVGTFKLGDGDYYTFHLAAKYSYTVEELDANKNGYETTVSGKTTDTLNDKDSAFVTFTNALQPASVTTNKTVSEGGELGDYTLTLDAYANGTITTVSKVKPADIVLIVDQSGSMLRPQDANTRLTKADLYNNADARNHASQGLYYLAFGNSTVNFLIFKDGKWYRYETNLPHHIFDENGKITSTDTGWDNYIPDIETILSGTPYKFTHTHNLRTGEKEETTYNMYLTELDENDSVWTAFTQRDNAPYSGIWQTRYGAAYDAMMSFVDDLHEKGVNHNIAIVGFGGPNEAGSALYIGSNSTQYNNLTATEYAAAFQDVSTAAGYASIVDSINALHTNQTQTFANVGLDIAKKVYANNLITPADSRDRITILFSDGATREADDGVHHAYEIKTTHGGTVYTVGTAGATPNFMQYTSSNYPNATTMSNYGDKKYDKYYFSASGANDLMNAFGTIMNEVSGTGVVLDENSVLRDTISGYFKIPDSIVEEWEKASGDDAKSAVLKKYINVYTANFTGKVDGQDTFDTGEPFEDAYIKMSKAGELFVIDVSGFDYADNHVATVEGKPRGKKLIVEIPIQISDSNTGGNHQPTNIDDDSGIYDEDKKIEDFELPHVDTPVDVTVKKKVTGNMGDWSKEFTFNATVTEYVRQSSGDNKYYDNEDDLDSGNSNYLEAKDRVQEVTYSDDADSKYPAFKLKHYQDSEKNSFTIPNLYYGSKVTISEFPENYTLTVNGETIEKDNEGKATFVVTELKGDMTIEFVNDYEVTIETGIALDSLPYILIIAIVVVGGAVLFLRKRKPQDD